MLHNWPSMQSNSQSNHNSLVRINCSLYNQSKLRIHFCNLCMFFYYYYINKFLVFFFFFTQLSYNNTIQQDNLEYIYYKPRYKFSNPCIIRNYDYYYTFRNHQHMEYTFRHKYKTHYCIKHTNKHQHIYYIPPNNFHTIKYYYQSTVFQCKEINILFIPHCIHNWVRR